MPDIDQPYQTLNSLLNALRLQYQGKAQTIGAVWIRSLTTRDGHGSVLVIEADTPTVNRYFTLYSVGAAPDGSVEDVLLQGNVGVSVVAETQLPLTWTLAMQEAAWLADFVTLVKLILQDWYGATCSSGETTELDSVVLGAPGGNVTGNTNVRQSSHVFSVTGEVQVFPFALNLTTWSRATGSVNQPVSAPNTNFAGAASGLSVVVNVPSPPDIEVQINNNGPIYSAISRDLTGP